MLGADVTFSATARAGGKGNSLEWNPSQSGPEEQASCRELRSVPSCGDRFSSGRAADCVHASGGRRAEHD